MSRALAVARIQTVSWPNVLGWPLGILALALAANLALFGTIDEASADGGPSTGGLLSIYIVMLVAYLQTMTQVFPFTLGLGVTRRDFLAGTALVVVTQAAALGLLLVVLLEVEKATGGWSLDVRFFGPEYLVQDNLAAQWLVYTVPFLALAAVGVFLGVVFKRWSQTGMYVLTIVTVVIVVAAMLVISANRWWGAVGSFFTDSSTFALLAGYPLLVAAVLAVASFVAIRRATP